MFDLNYTAVALNGFNKSIDDSKIPHPEVSCWSREFLDPDVHSVSTEVIMKKITKYYSNLK